MQKLHLVFRVSIWGGLGALLFGGLSPLWGRDWPHYHVNVTQF